MAYRTKEESAVYAHYSEGQLAGGRCICERRGAGAPLVSSAQEHFRYDLAGDSICQSRSGNIKSTTGVNDPRNLISSDRRVAAGVHAYPTCGNGDGLLVATGISLKGLGVLVRALLMEGDFARRHVKKVPLREYTLLYVGVAEAAHESALQHNIDGQYGVIGVQTLRRVPCAKVTVRV